MVNPEGLVQGEIACRTGDMRKPAYPSTLPVSLNTPFWFETELTPCNSGAIPEPDARILMIAQGACGCRLTASRGFVRGLEAHAFQLLDKRCSLQAQQAGGFRDCAVG